ncbi:hypothetical protein [Rhizomonospora bruguierae]|uniref:hypothetical protein n=1 Tax=Rhizomonospora bruguierae TaxID=1581705 RepID=UPI001BCF5101|nr:hypothetical protein [Micromonospora sp. NBRC 107566]
MQRPRFVFLTAPALRVPDRPVGDGILWVLVSPNNRQLGRGADLHGTYAACRQAVLDLRGSYRRAVAVELTLGTTGQWSWRVEVDGVPVAVASRLYLRGRECSYNLERFLEAVPAADVTAGVRIARRGRPRAVEPEPISRTRATGSGSWRPTPGPPRRQPRTPPHQVGQ